MTLFLLACSDPPTWTEERALTPTLQQMDRDHDGTVNAAEFDAVRHRARRFDEVDANKDGALDIGELQQIFFHSDPSANGLGPGDGVHPKRKGDKIQAANAPKKEAAEGAGPKKESGTSKLPSPDTDTPTGKNAQKVEKTPEQLRIELRGATLQVLLSLRDELLYVNRPTPTIAEMEAVAEQGSLYTAAARVMLDRLQTEAEGAGLSFPPSLTRTALAARPVDAPLVDPPPTE